MFTNNLQYELKLLFRNNWLVVLLISIVLLFTFAAFNGKKNVSKRLHDISRMQTELHKKDSLMLTNLTKIENGEKVDIPYWNMPSEPMTIGYRHPRLAIMKPEPLSFLATGQSDMYTHFKSPTVYGNNFALDYSEMVNPIQLLFGNFDLAFVIIYILPLLIIAFTFNILSKEKELGTLRLLGAQPISIRSWLLQKMTIRFVLFSIITVIALTITIISLDSFYSKINFIGLIMMIIGYVLFWFVLAYIINIKVNNSSKNAVALVGFWLVFVMILPATINQIGNAIYPTPSRLKMINEIRLIKKENEEKQNEIMNEYLRTHPELAQGNEQQKFGFWHNYFASEKIMQEKTKPLLAEYDTQLQKQQQLINIFKYFSPAILMQQSLNNIAGTSEKHYNDYKKQVLEFSYKWRNFLVPMLFKQQKFNIKSYNTMPNFTYKNRIGNTIWIHLLALVSMSSLLLVFVTTVTSKKKSIQKMNL